MILSLTVDRKKERERREGESFADDSDEQIR